MTVDTGAVQTVFEQAVGDAVDIIAVADVHDEETSEEFCCTTAAVALPDEAQADTVKGEFVAPLTGAYTQLVVEADLDYPLEAVTYLKRSFAGPDALALGAFRVSTMWAREHGHGNLSLEQLLALVWESFQRPDEPTRGSEWAPEYDTDWRQTEPPPADAFDAAVDYDYWTSGSVPYPGGESE